MAVAKRVAELEAQLAKTRAERDELLRDVETLCMQVQAFIRGNGVGKKVNAALEVNGTPNLLLQVVHVITAWPYGCKGVAGLEFGAVGELAAGSTQLHWHWIDSARHNRASRRIPRPDRSDSGADSCACQCGKHQLLVSGD